MKRLETTNTFSDGLVMDFNPLLTPNTVLTNALNATILTMNGNENVLLNDMGNGRVETAYLPEGYIPLGTAELGGIIYIASYNPLTGKSQIGSFPSPERNTTTDEIGKSEAQLNCKDFYGTNIITVDNTEYYPIITDTIKIILTDTYLKSGDKFCVGSDTIKKDPDEQILSAFNNINNNTNEDPRILKLSIVSLLDDGKIINLDNNLVWYETADYNYYIYYEKPTSGEKVNLTEYRNLINSNYSVFSPTSNIPGQLGILGKLEIIDGFNTSIDILKNGNIINCSFFANWTYSNDNLQSRSKINPVGILIEISNYSNSKESSEYFYLELHPEERKNDGTDDDVKAEKSIRLENKTGIQEFTIYPVMSYGYVQYLKSTLSVNMELLGTGVTNLNEYRYYVEENALTLSYGFDAYPEEGQSISSIKFNFYPFTDNNYKALFLDGWNDEDDDEGYKCIIKDSYITDDVQLKDELEYFIENTSSSMLGHFTEVIPLSSNTLPGLKKDQCYIVKITINYSVLARYYYRILYTSNIFNSAYYLEEDFNTLVLDDYKLPVPKITIQQLLTSEEIKYLDENEKCVDNIPNVLESSTVLEYTVKKTIKEKITLVLELESNTPITEKITDMLDINISESDSNDAVILYITSSAPISNIIICSDDLNLKTTTNNNKFLIDYEFETIVYTPIKILYTSLLYISVKYQLSPLVGEILYLDTYGRDRDCTLGVVEEFGNPCDGSYNVSTGDNNVNFYDRLSDISNVSTKILEELEDHDWVALIASVWHHKKGSPFAYGIGKENTGKPLFPNYLEGYGYYSESKISIDDNTAKFAYVLFCLKNEDRFTTFVPYLYFGKEYTLSDAEHGGEVKFFAVDGPSTSNTSGNLKDLRYYPKLSNTFESANKLKDEINDEFKDYYKVSEYSGIGLPRYVYSNIVYYNNYTITQDHKVNSSYCNYIKYINEVKVCRNSNIPNLKYKGFIESFSVPYQITKKINIDNILNAIMNYNLTSSNKIYSNGIFIDPKDSINRSYVYDVNGERKKLIYKSSAYIKDNYLLIIENTSLTGLTFYQRLEKLGFNIRDLKLINKNNNKNIPISDEFKDYYEYIGLLDEIEDEEDEEDENSDSTT